MNDSLITIGEAAQVLHISIDTLRRWDASGRLQSIRSGVRGHRYYRKSDLDQYFQDVSALAQKWAESKQPSHPEPEMYCQTRDVFQARLEQFQTKLCRITSLSTVSLITAIAGEIGNNSFDHNLGNWPDTIGIFFSYSFRYKKVVLADRGQGILSTLRRVRPELSNADEALRVAFTETVSGRYPETRGNGLKFVRGIVVDSPFTLYFQTGDAYISLRDHDSEISIHHSKTFLQGCFATIGFET